MGVQWHTGAAGIGIEAAINCNVDKCIDYAIRTYEFKIVLIFVQFELIYLIFKQICLQFELIYLQCELKFLPFKLIYLDFRQIYSTILYKGRSQVEMQ